VEDVGKWVEEKGGSPLSSEGRGTKLTLSGSRVFHLPQYAPASG